MPAATRARRLARDQGVRSGKVTLIGEADLEGDIGECATGLLEQLGCESNAPAQNVLMRRLPGALPEGTAEMPRRQSSDRGENLGPQAGGKIFLDVVAHAAQRAGRETAARQG